MNTSTINNTSFIYYSDLSEVIIIDENRNKVTINGSDLITFVLDYLKEEKIGKLEDMNEDDFLDYIMNKL